MSSDVRGTAATTHRFDERLRLESDRTGLWRATIDADSLGFGGGAHGGHLAALALRALEARPRKAVLPPRGLTLRFLEPTRPGPVDLAVEIDRLGGSTLAATVRMTQAGSTTCIAHGFFGAERRFPTHLGTSMPVVPPPEDCRPLIDKPAPESGDGILVEHRPAGDPLPLSGGDRAEILVWMRVSGGRRLDLAAATMLADAGPPALFATLTSFVAMPSAEIAIQYCDLAATADGPWLIGVFRTVFSADGYAVEDGELWTRSGRLVLVVRQVRRVLVRPDR